MQKDNYNSTSDKPNSEYLETKLKDIIEPLFLSLLSHRPKDITNFSIDWLMKKGGYTANGLTLEERLELVNLRKEIKKLREIDAEYEKLNSQKSTEYLPNVSDDEDDADDDLELEQETHNRHKSINVRGPRIAVSAEVYGEFNKKENYKPVVHEKSEDQITSIKARLIQSFLV